MARQRIGLRAMFGGRQILIVVILSGDCSIHLVIHTYAGIQRPMASDGAHQELIHVYIIGEMIIGYYRRN